MFAVFRERFYVGTFWNCIVGRDFSLWSHLRICNRVALGSIFGKVSWRSRNIYLPEFLPTWISTYMNFYLHEFLPTWIYTHMNLYLLEFQYLHYVKCNQNQWSLEPDMSLNKCTGSHIAFYSYSNSNIKGFV